MPTKLLRPRALAAASAMLVAGFGWASAAQAQQTFDEDVTIETPNTPSITFDQLGTGGWSPYAWDIAANEANFFVRDAETDNLTMSIRAGAPRYSIYVAPNGELGLGRSNPSEALHLKRADAANVRYETNAGSWTAGTPAGETFAIASVGGPDDPFALTPLGGLALGGRVAERATSAGVEEEAAVHPAQILNGVRSLSLSQWQYAGDPDDVRHVGPLAGEFNATFGLGDSNTVAPGDVAGVALAASQRLADENRILNRRLQRTNRKVGRVAKQLRALKRAVG